MPLFNESHPLLRCIPSVICFLCLNPQTGTDKERGLLQWKQIREASKAAIPHRLRQQLSETYDLPFVMPWIRRWKWTRRVPFCPTFRIAVLEPEDAEAEPIRNSTDEAQLETVNLTTQDEDNIRNLGHPVEINTPA